MPVKTELQQIDKLRVSTIFDRRDALHEILMRVGTAGKIGEEVGILVPELVQLYADRLHVAVEVMEQSLYALLSRNGTTHPTWADCRRANWILAANVDWMRQGHPVGPFSRIFRPEWTPAVIIDAYEDCTYMGIPGSTYVIRSMGGYTATEEFKNFVPSAGGRWFVHVTMLGLAKRRYKFFQPKEYRQPIDAPKIYVGMYSWVLIEPGCKFGAPFERTQCSPDFQKFNRNLFNERHADCVVGKTCSCTECALGMSTCHRGTHEGDYVSRHCAGHHGMGLFKATSTSPMCNICDHAAFLKRKRGAIRHRKDDNGNEHEAEGVGTLVQPSAGSVERVAEHADESGGIRSGSEVEHQSVAGDPGPQG